MSQYIKAIETRYKGYKFRSRLEARWAVFFDELDLNWTYETEGYQLKTSGKYLPDFFFPESNLFVEIKPLIDKEDTCKTVYMAGVMPESPDISFLDPSNWRYHLGVDFPELIREHNGELSLRNMSGMHYCGPYPQWLLDNSAPESLFISRSFYTSIRLADILFAWVSYGCGSDVFWEICFAKSLGKKVYIAFDDSSDNTQFSPLVDIADFVTRASCPQDAFVGFFPLAPEEQKIRELHLALHSDVTIMYGDPYEFNVTWICDSFFIRKEIGAKHDEYSTVAKRIFNTIDSEKIREAAINSRAARFEN